MFLSYFLNTYVHGEDAKALPALRWGQIKVKFNLNTLGSGFTDSPYNQIP